MTLARENLILGEKPDPSLFDKSKSHMDWPGIEVEPLR
jgi:hypothetical protein